MIARSAPLAETPEWVTELRAAYRDPMELLRDLGLADTGDIVTRPAFPFRVPRPYARRMRFGDPGDPLLRQVLPLSAEAHEVPGFVSDPVGDEAARRSPSLLHKYRSRVLLMLSGACAVHCRYCFRREYPYGEAIGRPRLDEALAVIRADASIREVILSGGDPLVLADEALQDLAQRLADIPHVQRLRIHSRVPVVIPARLTEGLKMALTGTRLAPVMVLHINHPAEIDAQLVAGVRQLSAHGVLMLNQAVLLAGVNDSVEVLGTLSETLFAAGIQPYYLHLLDRVRGSAHFDLAETRAHEIFAELHASLPGYLVPRLVREEAGRPGKTLLGPAATIAHALPTVASAKFPSIHPPE